MLEVCDRHELSRPCFFLLAGRLVASVEFTSPVTMEIKYNVRGRAWLEDKQVAKRGYLI